MKLLLFLVFYYICICVGFFGGAFGFRGRIAEREYDWSLVECGHFLDDLFRECFSLRCAANQRIGLDKVDRSLQRFRDGSVFGEWRLLVIDAALGSSLLFNL